MPRVEPSKTTTDTSTRLAFPLCTSALLTAAYNETILYYLSEKLGCQRLKWSFNGITTFYKQKRSNFHLIEEIRNAILSNLQSWLVIRNWMSSLWEQLATSSKRTITLKQLMGKEMLSFKWDERRRWDCFSVKVKQRYVLHKLQMLRHIHTSEVQEVYCEEQVRFPWHRQRNWKTSNILKMKMTKILRCPSRWCKGKSLCGCKNWNQQDSRAEHILVKQCGCNLVEHVHTSHQPLIFQ